MIRIRKATGTSFAAILIIASFAAGCATTETTSARTVAAGTGTSEDANYVARAETDENQETMICKRSQPTGSRISERICMTAEDWEKAGAQSREMLDRATRKAQQYED